MKLGIQALLIIGSIFMAYLIWDSIESKIILTETVNSRNEVVRARLEQVRDAQVEYKKTRGEYANSFDKLIDFLENDSIPLVKMIGEVPDSLLGKEDIALALGIIIRDTIKNPVRNIIFTDNFEAVVDSLPFIPYAGGKKFTINSGEVEKGKVRVKVFEVKAALTDVYKGLKTDNEGYDMTSFIAIGSMEEPTTNGNW